MRTATRWLRRTLILLALLLLLGGATVLVLYRTAPERLLDANFAAERWWGGLGTRSIDIDGSRWRYNEGGRGEPVLLVHGMAGSKENWSLLAHYLTGHYRVIVPDQLGFGASPNAPDGNYRVTVQAKRLKAFADALGLQRLHLVGHSMGGHIAGVFAGRYPERVQSLTLMDSAGVHFKPNAFSERIERGENPFATETTEKFDAFMAMIFVHPPFAPERLRMAYAARNAPRARLWGLILKRQIAAKWRFYLEDHLDKIQAPSLLVWCDQDRLLDVSSVAAFRTELPGARVEILNGCGHMPMMERPRETAALLSQHFEKAR